MSVSAALRRVVTSVKSAVGITSAASFPVFGITSSSTGQLVTRESAMRVPAVSRAVSLIAEGVGSLPVKLFDRQTKQAENDHRLYGLVHDMANPWTSAEDLRIEVTTDALLSGHGFALVVRNSTGEPIELHRLDPGQVRIETADDGEPTYIVRYTHGERRHPFTDILHVKAFGGVSPVHLGREAIGLSLALEAHVSKLFANGARPSGILKTEKKLGDEAKGKLSESWKAAHGAGRSGGTALLDEGMTYERITETLTDAQFMENRQEQVREIARVFRVPPPMLFEMSRATWSNSEEMGRQFLTFTLKPWLAVWSAAYARCLLTQEERHDYYFEFITADLLTATEKDRAEALTKYRSGGIMTANEARAAINLAPRADGDNLDNPFTSTGATSTPANQDTAPDE